MSSKNSFYHYLPDGTAFSSQKASLFRTVYLPLCGPDAGGLKSSITPQLSGDIKIDKSHYLTKPVSTEDLRSGLRNFFVSIDGNRFWSLNEEIPFSPTESRIEVGQLWQKLIRIHAESGMELSCLNFIPSTGETCEIMQVAVKNISQHNLKIIPTGVVPLFGRSLANKHDHEHVTSLLNRTSQKKEGVLLEPSMVFNEEGHKSNGMVYYVFGCDSHNNFPSGTFPTMESFYGDGGTFFAPEAVVQNLRPRLLSEKEIQGKETVGALQFETVELTPGETREYILVLGIAKTPEAAVQTFNRFNTTEKISAALEETKRFWENKSKAIQFSTGDSTFNSWMSWVTIQPVLRRIFGNSFLPDHDYGKGGKGWRDIWQDLLSLILIEPEEVRGSLVHNFAGVRIDGTNATIIGNKPGEFIADRNAIVRVWMDHGLWPLTTILLYIHQTGDSGILFKENTYFRDQQFSRTFVKDTKWAPSDDNRLKTKKGAIYKGTVLEHILVQHLVQFFNVGEHNLIRLESADWNDGLDMGFSRGESTAFTSFYGGNLLALADLLESLSQKKKLKSVSVAKEISILLDSLSRKPVRYDSVKEKKDLLFKKYFKAVQPTLSGTKISVPVDKLVNDLRKKGEWIFEHLRESEWVSVKENATTYSWMNGYYDNKGKRVEGSNQGHVRMTLTGQVFSIMSGMASRDEIVKIVESVRRFLKDPLLGGFRLNTDFGILHYLDLGRAFGFAYGTKENGAFFSHMNVMYAYALYSRRFVREGREVLRSIQDMCLDTDKSKIYPGIPEYFSSEGRGMYHYLTGSASWLALTELIQVFGVRGEFGDLVLDPKLMHDEFSDEGKAEVSCSFAEKKLTVSYLNSKRLDYGDYSISQVLLNGQPLDFSAGRIPRKILEKTSGTIQLQVVLS